MVAGGRPAACAGTVAGVRPAACAGTGAAVGSPGTGRRTSATFHHQEIFFSDHLRHCVLNAARASEADGADSLTEVAAAIRQVIRL
jgi:hypothetical protein